MRSDLRSRRSFLGGAAAYVAAGPRTAEAYRDCQADNFGRPYCHVGIQSQDFRFVRADQRMMFWCWAATLQMIFDWHGYSISQDRIVAQTFGAVVNLPADPFVLINSVNRQYIDNFGDPFSVDSLVYSVDFGVAQIDNRDLVASLSAERPMVYCNNSHMMVLIGAGYWDVGFPQVFSAWVADPWPGAQFAPDMGPGFRDLSQAEMVPVQRGGQLRFVAEVSVS